jgi:hypothetical protein
MVKYSSNRLFILDKLWPSYDRISRSNRLFILAKLWSIFGQTVKLVASVVPVVPEWCHPVSVPGQTNRSECKATHMTRRKPIGQTDETGQIGQTNWPKETCQSDWSNWSNEMAKKTGQINWSINWSNKNGQRDWSK